MIILFLFWGWCIRTKQFNWRVCGCLFSQFLKKENSYQNKKDEFLATLYTIQQYIGQRWKYFLVFFIFTLIFILYIHLFLYNSCDTYFCLFKICQLEWIKLNIPFLREQKSGKKKRTRTVSVRSEREEEEMQDEVLNVEEKTTVRN